jgi:hypothetical protein
MTDQKLDTLLKELGATDHLPVQLEARVWTAISHDGSCGDRGIGPTFGQLFGWQGAASLISLAAVIGFGASGFLGATSHAPHQPRGSQLMAWVGDVGTQAPSSILGD